MVLPPEAVTHGFSADSVRSRSAILLRAILILTNGVTAQAPRGGDAHGRPIPLSDTFAASADHSGQ
jgi:hypothetical protein